MVDDKKDMIEDAYSYVRFDLTKSNELRSLYKRVNGRDLSETIFFEKFNTEKIGGEPIGYFAYSSEGQAVAYYGVFPVRVIKDGRIHIAAQSGNTMTDPDHQGKGLFTKLAKLTYEAAEKENISFVFGFPNKNSYPGFIRKLNWKHKITMNGYNFIVPTIPLAQLFDRYSSLNSLYRKYSNWFSEIFAEKFLARELKTCLQSGGMGHCLRDENYSNYKRSGLFVLRKSNCEIYFKIGRCIEIGDVYFESMEGLKSAIRFLKILAFLLGVVRIRFYVTPGTATSKAFDSLSSARSGLAYGHLALSDVCEPDSFAFSFIDYDTY